MRRFMWSTLINIGLLVFSTPSFTSVVIASPSQATTLTIPAAQSWTDTSIDLRQGDFVNITSSGIIYIDDSAAEKTPDGDFSCTVDASFSAPDLRCWSLIGKIGDGIPFEVGTRTTFSATTSGRLFLGVNDNIFSDNSGSWIATISSFIPAATPRPNQHDLRASLDRQDPIPTLISHPQPRLASTKMFVLLGGLASQLSSQDASRGNIPTDSFGEQGAIVSSLRVRYPDSIFKMFSYNKDDGHGSPLAYSCEDTFMNFTYTDVQLLKAQLINLMNTTPNLDIYLIGHDFGGVVAFGLLTDIQVNGPIDSNGGKIVGIVTLDSPLGGIPGSPLGTYFQIVANHFEDKDVCPALKTKNLPLNSLTDMTKIFTGTGLPYGAHGSIMSVVNGGHFSNQEIADAAAQNDIAILAIGNIQDYAYWPLLCPNVTLFPNARFLSTQWLSNKSGKTRVYGQIFIGGNSPSCSNINQLEINHNAVFTDPFVKTGLQQFIEKQAITLLLPAPLTLQ